ncbi:hypothetical protein ACFOG5_03465 [Pedobacter fastidiosus]
MKTLNLQSLSEPSLNLKKVENSVSIICCPAQAICCMCCCMQ